MSVELHNLTPHDVIINIDNAEQDGIVQLESEGVARASEVLEAAGTVEVFGIEVPVVEVTYGPPIDLPDPAPGHAYIVSAVTVEAARRAGRTTSDLYTPAELIRDKYGRVVACQALARH
jgi:hypothetical protein